MSETYHAEPTKEGARELGAGGRRCTICKMSKPLSEFAHNTKDVSVHGRRYTCLDCQAMNPGRAKKYGIRPQKLADLMAQQDGKCAICRHPPNEGAKLAIDHDHTTGQVRGLLCTACNMAIGMLRDDPFRLCAALEYLGYGAMLEVESRTRTAQTRNLR